MAPMLIGLQLNVCSFELSVYCGPHCVVCPYPEDTWLVHSIPGLCSAGNLTLSKLSFWEPVWVQESVSLGYRVRATSFILLLGVGSFVCYRLFHQLKRRLAKGSKRSSLPRAPPAKLRKISSTQRRTFYPFVGDLDELSSAGNSDFSDTSSCASYGDGETTSDTPSLSDGYSDSVVMGVTSSNTFEPVYFSKASGIQFRGGGHTASTPLDHIAKNSHTRHSPNKCHRFPNNEFNPSSDYKENIFSCSGSFNASGSYQDFQNSNNFDSASYDAPFKSHDAASMHGNFSPGSLRERTLRTEQLISAKLDTISKSNTHVLKRDASVDSLTYNSEQEFSGPTSKQSLSRTLSVDSEVSELCIELQRQAEEVHEMGILTFEKMENLEDEINDIKQTVLELDADLVGLKVYKKPPANCWELTNISQSDRSLCSEMNSSDLVDVIHHHKKKMWYKGLLDAELPPTEPVDGIPAESSSAVVSPKWDQICDRLLDWDVSADNPFENDLAATDSGSDFGNSLETDSPDLESASINGSVSLEWDTNYVSEFGGTSVCDVVDSSPKPKKSHQSSKTSSRKTVPHQSKSVYEDHSHRFSFKKKHRSLSIPALSQQIKGALHKRLPTSQSSQTDISFSPISSHLTSPLTETEGSPMQTGATSSIVSNTTCSTDCSSQCAVYEDGSGMLTAARTEISFSSGGQFTQEDNVGQERKDSNGNLPSRLVKSVNRDSAYCEGVDFPEVVTVDNVGPVVDVRELREKYVTEQTNLLHRVYLAAEEKLGLTHIRRIRGDGYSIIRATLYQLLSQGLPVLQHYGGAAAVYQLLSSWAKDVRPWLLDWAFAENLPYNNNCCLQGFWDCLQSLESMEAALGKVPDRGQHLATVLNENPDLDVQMLEAVKLLMCVSACQLHSSQAEDSSSSVPVFVMLLFDREGCASPEELVLNRLNRVGLDRRLQQVEIYLLGYSLSVTLQIVQFKHFGCRDFISYYPDCNLGSWSEITLVAEDDEHYSVATR